MDRLASITYNRKSSLDFGLYLLNPQTTSSEKDLATQSVTGLNGDILVDNQRFKNTTQHFDFYVQLPSSYPNFYSLQSDISNWLSNNDYKKLWFSERPDYFWEAIPLTAPTIVQSSGLSGTGSADFYCKPFLKRLDGQKWQNLGSSTTIINDESWVAEPVWHISGGSNTTLTVNGVNYVINGQIDDLYIDSERLLVYDANQNNRMGLVQFPNYDFPTLLSGKNTVSISGDSTVSLSIQANWRRLA